MRGHGQKLSLKQEALIAALLTQPTHAEAATTVGVSEATLQRWLLLPAFQTAYRQARRSIVETAIGRLQQTAGKAVDTLERNLACGQAGNEIRAALGILDHATKAAELLDLVERVEELERLIKEGQDDERQESHRQATGSSPHNGTEAPPNDPPPAVFERNLGRTASAGAGIDAAGIRAATDGNLGPDPGVSPEALA
jgi:hypothetical protein